MINSDTISAGLTIWQKRHMPRAPRFWGPRAYSLLFPPEFFVLCFIAGPKWCASAGPKEPKFPRKREAPKFKKRGPKERGPKRFFRSLFQRGGPNSPSATENARPKNLKREGPKGILFPAVSVSARGPKEPMVPQRARPQTVFSFPVSARDPNSVGPNGPNAKPNIKKCPKV